jgi:hypothetical protein
MPRVPGEIMMQIFRCPVPSTSYFVDVPAETKKQARKKAVEIFQAQINKRGIDKTDHIL